MPGKLDQSLDEIATAQRQTAGRRRQPKRNATGRVVTAAPIGGIKKAVKPIRTAGVKAAPAKGAKLTGESKIIVSNLPKDVSEQQIKDYFVQSVGSIKRVDLSYGPNSVSRGIANVSFNKPDGASTAFKKLNGLLVDGRPIKIEIVVGAAQADMVIPPAKSLAQRTTQPKGQTKAQPKSAAAVKPKAVGTKGAITKADAKAAAGKKGGRARARTVRPSKKTTEELDSEMADYFVAPGTEGAPAAAVAAPAAAAPAATGGDAMEDEIM